MAGSTSKKRAAHSTGKSPATRTTRDQAAAKPTSKSAPAPKTRLAELSLVHARSIWLARQSLAVMPPDVATLLDRSGWMPTAGGGGPYLSVRARLGGRPGLLDDAIASGEIADVPSLRGTTMLVPERDIALSLAAGRIPFDEARAKSAGELSLRQTRDLRKAILRALDDGASTVDAIRERVPAALVRPSTREMTALALSTTLGVEMRELVLDGEVRRHPAKKRIDLPGHRYERARGFTPWTGRDPLRELAKRFFRWAAPASAAEFAAWAGCGVREAREALEAADLAPILVEGIGEAFVPKSEALPRELRHAVFLPFRDNYLGLRRGLPALLAPGHRSARILDWNQKRTVAGNEASLHHHAIVDPSGRLCGIWEWNAHDLVLEWELFRPNELRAKDVRTAAESAESFVKKELGDLRFYPLDSEGNRRARLHAVRALAIERR